MSGLTRPRGRVLAPPRGGTLRRAPSARAAPLRASPAQSDSIQAVPARAAHPFAGLLLGLVLPMFAQCFQYMTDIPPLYLLSKVWPFLMLPAFLWAVLRVPMPYKSLHLANLFWLLAVTPAMGIIQLGNSFPDAMATTVKVWSFTYALSLAGILAMLRPDPALLRRLIFGLGAGTYVLMLALWILVPASAYGGGDLDTKLFMTDVERGYRIYMPMFFGLLLVFTINRSMMQRFAIWKPVLIVIAFVLLLAIYKQRTAIAAAGLAMAVGACLSLRRWRLAAFSGLALVGGIGLAFLLLRSQMSNELKSSLGASLAVREVSVATAWSYISADPLRWLLGVGGTTRLGEVTLARLFNNPMFFLTDIGWLGVLFEYGAIGVALMLAVHFAGLRLALKWTRRDDPLTGALADYIVYLLATSFIYSVVFTPGELMTVMALSWYLAHSYGSGASHSASPRPRHSAVASMLALGPFPSGIARSG